MVWFRFFFGTPRRFVVTMSVLGVLVVIAFPGLLEMAILRLVCALLPLVRLAVTGLVIYFGLRMIFRKR